MDLCHWALARSYRDNIQGCLVKKEGCVIRHEFLPPQKEGPPFPLPVYGPHQS